jgi:ribokinase
MPTPVQISNEIKWKHVDWLVVNQVEVQQLLDAFPASPTTSPTEFSLTGYVSDIALRSSALISRLASQPSFKNVNIACTLGPLGVLVRLSSATDDGHTQIIYEPGVQIKEVKDTTGAGDCWTGYLVAGLMELEVKSALTSNILDEATVRCLLRKCNLVRRYLINGPLIKSLSSFT